MKWRAAPMLPIICPPVSRLLLLLILILQISSVAAETIDLERQGGTYTVPVRINDTITLGFVLDSGASDTQIPADVLLTLFRSRTISPSDFIGTRTYTLADGSKVPSDRFTIRELKIGDHIIRNVEVSIGSVKGEPLLGQSFLIRLPVYTVDNQRKVLILGEGSSTAESQASLPMRPIPRREPAEQPLSRLAATLCGQTVSYTVDPSETADRYSKFLGAWTGTWNNPGRICGGLIIKKVNSDGQADIIYVYGPSGSAKTFPWRQQQTVGMFETESSFLFKDEQGSHFLFDMQNPDLLNGLFQGTTGRLSSQFSKITN
jgi:hypothetical protein